MAGSCTFSVPNQIIITERQSKTFVQFLVVYCQLNQIAIDMAQNHGATSLKMTIVACLQAFYSTVNVKGKKEVMKT